MRQRGTELSGIGKFKKGLALVENQQNGLILLVEEDSRIALSVKLQLELDGFEVEMFADPSAALDAFVKKPSVYRLVIADMKMVKMSAFEFMRSVKNADYDSKILLITPFEIRSNEFSKVLPSSKVNGFIERPLLPTKLISSVREVLAIPYGENLKP